MRHDITVEGFAFRLRPVNDDDADEIIRLRTDPELNQFLHKTSGDRDDQIRWLHEYYERAGDYYFALERISNGRTEGFIGIYDIDDERTRGEWGRWILRQGSPASMESVYLLYTAAFEIIGLEHIYCRTISDNKHVVSFHNTFGYTEEQILVNHFNIHGTAFDAVEHLIDSDTWIKLKKANSPLVQRMARRIQ